MYDIMNLLEDRFKHASSSVVLGAIKVFLHLTRDDEDLSKQVFERLQTPLITLMTSSETTESYEVSYTKHCVQKFNVRNFTSLVYGSMDFRTLKL